MIRCPDTNASGNRTQDLWHRCARHQPPSQDCFSIALNLLKQYYLTLTFTCHNHFIAQNLLRLIVVCQTMHRLECQILKDAPEQNPHHLVLKRTIGCIKWKVYCSSPKPASIFVSLNSFNVSLMLGPVVVSLFGFGTAKIMASITRFQAIINRNGV